MSSSVSRRRFVRMAAGTSVGLAIATVFGQKAPVASAQAECATGACDLQNPPVSTGSPQEQAIAKATVLRSSQFKQYAKDQRELVRGHFDVPAAVVNVDSNLATVAIWSTVKARSVVLLFWVNLTERTVIQVSELIITDVGNKRAHVVFSDENGVINDIVVDNDGIVTASGEQFEPLAYVDHVQQQNSYTIFGVCEVAVTGLCGLGGGAACFGACLALGLVSGPGGLGCAAVCGLIAAYGCAEAQRRICG